MPFTKRITIERYKDDLADVSAGLIEGETESGDRWIIFLDSEGKPSTYWPDREPETGAVRGEGIPLQFQSTTRLSREGGVLEKMSEEVLKPVDGEQLVSTFPVFTPEQFPAQLDGDPTDYTGLKRGVVFCVAQPGENPSDAMRAFVYELAGFMQAEDAIDGE